MGKLDVAAVVVGGKTVAAVAGVGDEAAAVAAAVVGHKGRQQSDHKQR